MDWFIYVLVSLIIIFVIVCFVIGYAIFKSSIPTDSKAIEVKYPVSDEKTNEMNEYFERKAKELESLNMEHVYTRGFDGIRLHAYYKEAKEHTDNTIICVHGYKGTSLTTAPKYSHWLVNFNYNILYIDQRGYGLSEGKYSTYGVLEYKDVLSWIDYICEKVGNNVRIALFGMSLGGCSVLNCSDKVREEVKCIISDSAFTSCKEIMKSILKSKSLPSFLLAFDNFYCKKIAKFNMNDADSRIALKSSKVPVLFMHSTADNFVPFYMYKELYEACSSHKESKIFDICPHVRLSYFYKEIYRKTVLDFLGRYL